MYTSISVCTQRFILYAINRFAALHLKLVLIESQSQWAPVEIQNFIGWQQAWFAYHVICWVRQYLK